MSDRAVASRLQIVSTSSESDGSFVAISEIGALLSGKPHRLIGGVAVVLHQYQLGLDHPIRPTADADFGVPLFPTRRRHSPPPTSTLFVATPRSSLQTMVRRWRS